MNIHTKIFMDDIKYRLSNVGKVPICNLKPERAPHIKNFCFPLCWRCTSFGLSVILIKLVIIMNGDIFNYNIWIGILMHVPIVIDGIAQYHYKYESTNIRRIITGLLAGVGYTHIYNFLRFNI